MTLRRGHGGALYGDAPVILAKEVDGEYTFIVGYAAPFGGIRYIGRELEGRYLTEEPHEWWEAQGWSITEAKELDIARDSLREVRAARLTD